MAHPVCFETGLNNACLVNIPRAATCVLQVTSLGSQRAMTGDRRKRGRFLAPPHVWPQHRRPRTVLGAGLSARAEPAPTGTAARPTPAASGRPAPAQRPALRALTRHANGLQHRPAEAAGGGRRGRGGARAGPAASSLRPRPQRRGRGEGCCRRPGQDKAGEDGRRRADTGL